MELANEACELLRQQTEFIKTYSFVQLAAAQRTEYLRRQERIRELMKKMAMIPPRVTSMRVSERAAESI